MAPELATGTLTRAAVLAGGYAWLLATSSRAVGESLRRFTGTALTDLDDETKDTGWLIGKCENVLVVTLVLVGAYTALGIIFAAKSLVRREDTSSEDTTYYLTGTLVNFTYSLLVGLAILAGLRAV